MLTETVIFRATDELAVAIQQRAAEAGLNVSEYLRQIISERVVPRECVSPVCAKIAYAAFFDDQPNAYFAERAGLLLRKDLASADPIALLPRAGAGDTQAQRDIADMAILLALSGNENADTLTVLSEGLMFARLADRHGDVDDALRIVTMLALASTLNTGAGAMTMAGEAIARLELIADGDSMHADDAARMLANCADDEQPETLQTAQEYRARLTAKEIA